MEIVTPLVDDVGVLQVASNVATDSNGKYLRRKEKGGEFQHFLIGGGGGGELRELTSVTTIQNGP